MAELGRARGASRQSRVDRINQALHRPGADCYGPAPSMLGSVRAKAAPFLVALLSAFAFQASFALTVSDAAAATSKKKKKKKKPKPAQPAPVDESDDIEITTIDPGTPKQAQPKPSQPKAQKGKQKKPKKTDEVVPEEIVLEEEPEKPPPEPEPKPRSHENWGTLAIQQDFLVYSTTGNVCPSITPTGVEVDGHYQYSCRDANGLYTGPVVNGLGNTVQGGFGIATTRILLGYERVLMERITAGARLGWAFRTAPTVVGVGPSLPFHFELRGAYYFGSAPFERRSIRPFVSLAAGIGQVDGSVNVDVYPQAEGPVTQVVAWRRTGTGFLGFGGGAAYPIGDFAINAELRGLLMIGAPAFGLGLNVGAAYGF
jgi:hypothetical protein